MERCLLIMTIFLTAVCWCPCTAQQHQAVMEQNGIGTTENMTVSSTVTIPTTTNTLNINTSQVLSSTLVTSGLTTGQATTSVPAVTSAVNSNPTTSEEAAGTASSGLTTGQATTPASTSAVNSNPTTSEGATGTASSGLTTGQATTPASTAAVNSNPTTSGGAAGTATSAATVAGKAKATGGNATAGKPSGHTCVGTGNKTITCVIGCFAIYEKKRGNSTIKYGCSDIVTNSSGLSAIDCGEDSQQGECLNTQADEVCTRCCIDKDRCNAEYRSRDNFPGTSSRQSSASSFMTSGLILVASLLVYL